MNYLATSINESSTLVFPAGANLGDVRDKVPLGVDVLGALEQIVRYNTLTVS